MEQSKTSGGDRRLKPPTSISDHLERGEEQEVFRRESGGFSSPTPLQDDSTRDDAEVKNDVSTITGPCSSRESSLEQDGDSYKATPRIK